MTNAAGKHPGKAIVLVSGGLDSATTLAMASAAGFRCYALSFDYSQRHVAELDAARAIAQALGAVEHRVINIDLRQFGGSALTDASIDVPVDMPTASSEDIPVTYVPARNTVFLALGLAWAEVLRAHDIFIGVNAVDYSGYPDCRPEFIDAFTALANVATKASVEGQKLTIHTPLIHLTKAEIIAHGVDLGVDYAATVSCYQADRNGSACGVCDSCRIRAEGFRAAGVNDPTRYVSIGK
jgi:7-cyano-7-deazaguanine synthase